MEAKTTAGRGNVNFLVTGMHRSGTSALAAALRAGGIAVGDEDALLPATDDNPDGYVERRDVYELNERLLSSLGWMWDAPDPAPLSAPSLRPWFISEARALVTSQLSGLESWLIKDPRLSILIPWWRRVLIDRIAVIVLVRSPEEVAWSLALRDGIPVTCGLALWAAYYRHLAAGLEGLPAVTVRYEALTNAPSAIVPKVLESLSSLAGGRVFDVDLAIAAVRPELRRATQPETMTRGRDSDRVRAMLDLWPADDVWSSPRFSLQVPGPEPWEMDTLDEHRRLRKALVAVDQPGALVAERTADAEKLESDLAERGAEVGRLESDLAEERAEGDRVATALEAVEAMLVEEDTETDRLTVALSAAELEGYSLRRDLAEEGARAEELATEMARIAAPVASTPQSPGPTHGRRGAAAKATMFAVVTRLPVGWRNPLLDRSWYLAMNPDVRNKGADPGRHYRRHGAREGRNPNLLFDTLWYLAQNSDVRAKGMNPLDHFLRFGGMEGRDPHPEFDTAWYLAQNPDVAASGMNPLLHYIRHGAAEGRDPNPRFDTPRFLAENPHAAASGINPLAYALLRGRPGLAARNDTSTS